MVVRRTRFRLDDGGRRLGVRVDEADQSPRVIALPHSFIMSRNKLLVGISAASLCCRPACAHIVSMPKSAEIIIAHISMYAVVAGSGVNGVIGESGGVEKAINLPVGLKAKIST